MHPRRSRQGGIYSNLPGQKLLLLLFLFIIHSLSIVAQEESKSPIVGLLVGAGYGKLRSNDVADFAFKPSYTIQTGISLEIPIPKLEKRGTFYNELTFSQFDAKSFVHIPDTSQGSPELNYSDVTQNFAPYLLTITNMFRYCFVNSSFKYYVGAGIYNSFIISLVNRKTSVVITNGTAKTTEGEVVADHSIHGLMLILSTGISYKYIGLEFRFDPGRNFTKKIDYSVYNPTFSMLLHMRFNP
jgi:hypothetical protein